MKLLSKLKFRMPSSPQALAAMVCLLLAAWMFWNAWELHAASRLSEQTDMARARVAKGLKPDLQTLIDAGNGLRKDVTLIAALGQNDLMAAHDAVAKKLTGVQAVEFYAPDMADGYADMGKFGIGKLGVLEKSMQDMDAVLAVVKDAGSPRLAVAFPVWNGDKIGWLAYVRLSLGTVLEQVKDQAPAGAYLAVRQGRYTVATSGPDNDLKEKAETNAVSIEGTPLRVVAVAPEFETGLFELKGLSEFVLALLFAAIAAALLNLSKLRGLRAPATVLVHDDGNSEMTLSQMQSAGHLKAPEAPTRGTGETEAMPSLVLDRSIFRAYDIRGIVGQTLDANIARLIGQAIGSAMQERGQRSVVVCRDGRLSSPSMSGALIEGLRKSGREVIDIGEAPTPVAYFASFHLRSGCCVAVTGSHNPPDYNGFKIVIDGDTLSGDAILNLYARIAENKLYRADKPGPLSLREIKADYIDRISGDIQIERKLKVVVDCGSGVAGNYAPELLQAIGAEIEPLYCEVDGTFPHHHPDPSDPANLQDLIRIVQKVGADIGLAFDGDGDRLGVVTRSGEVIYPDRLLMLFAADVLERNPGACVIYDVKCTSHLATHILRNGGSPLMWKTGHSLIKAKMKETEAELAGEMSGHFFFRERWYGFDDGLYAAARLLEILAASPDDVETVFATLPKGVSTPELKISVAEGEQYKFVDEFVTKAKFEGARIATIDGLRADWPDGWGLVRASNTTPALVLRFDAKDTAALARIEQVFREQLLAIKPEMILPF